MKYSLVCSMIFISGLISGCGSSDDGGGSTPQGSALFKQDMQWLSTSSMVSAKAADGQMNGALTKAFGGTTKSDVFQFISDRIKYVYNVSEAVNFKVSAFSNGSLLGQGTLGEIMGESATLAKDDYTAGMNAGAGLAVAGYDNDFQFKVHLPEGTVSAESTRVGIVLLTKYYSVVPGANGQQHQTPREGRVSILVHEARHSDCPNGFGKTDCGFGHSECTTGDMAGIPACDNNFWGPYAMGALYLRGTQDNYPYDSKEYRLIEFLADDSLSRLTSAQKNALYNTEPDLNSL